VIAAFARPQDVVPDEVPIDRNHLTRQIRGTHTDLVSYYLTHGLAQRLDPTPFFATDWYAWQNPDWTSHAAPYLHYLDRGQAEGRDPSPFVDMRRYLDATGLSDPTRAYGMILAGLRGPSLGVYDGPDDLRRRQRAFLDAISPLAHRMSPPATPRPALVVLQAGAGAVRRDWSGEGRTWDLLVNYYDARGFRPGFGDMAMFQKGTKFTAMWMFWHRYRSCLSPYEHVLFLDDDVSVGVDELNSLFKACRTHGLDLAQMTLTPQSSCNWPQLFARQGQDGPRDVSAVEIMMPVVSRRALDWIAPTFGASVSGFGLDLAWGRIVRDRGGRVAVLDDVRATHERPVDQSGGSYYSYLRRHGINAKAELWTTIQAHGADRDVLSL
jgi:hypothetical protein